jgi:hypothetical protein
MVVSTCNPSCSGSGNERVKVEASVNKVRETPISETIWVWCLVSVIPVTREAEIGGS